MKRLFLSVALIAILVGLCALHVKHLTNLTDSLIGELEGIRDDVAAQRWQPACESAQRIETQWNDHAFYLHTTLRHTDIDQILTSMKELGAFLASREDQTECLVAAARLITQLSLLLEAELPTFKNVL